MEFRLLDLVFRKQRRRTARRRLSAHGTGNLEASNSSVGLVPRTRLSQRIGAFRWVGQRQLARNRLVGHVLQQDLPEYRDGPAADFGTGTIPVYS